MSTCLPLRPLYSRDNSTWKKCHSLKINIKNFICIILVTTKPNKRQWHNHWFTCGNSELDDGTTYAEGEKKNDEQEVDLVSSAKRPIGNRPKTLKHERDEEEYQLITGLASTITDTKTKIKLGKRVHLMHLEFTLLKHCQNSIPQWETWLNFKSIIFFSKPNGYSKCNSVPVP